jgi:hypothetical protein
MIDCGCDCRICTHHICHLHALNQGYLHWSTHVILQRNFSKVIFNVLLSDIRCHILQHYLDVLGCELTEFEFSII